jgi:hypothetical protein
VTSAFTENDATCQVSSVAVAQGGTVVVTNADPSVSGSMQGTFTLQFGTDTLNGSFDAPTCEGTAAATTSCQ